MDAKPSAASLLREAFGKSDARVATAFAPLRLSPLGAHTDHQRGFACGFTLNAGVRLHFRPAGGGEIRLRSLAYGGEVLVDVSRAGEPVYDGSFGDLAKGVVKHWSGLHGLPPAFEGLFDADLPAGGVGSSAAIQVAVLQALGLLAGRGRLQAEAGAALIQAAERESTGARVGILDPLVILAGKERALVMIDVRDGRPHAHSLPRACPPLHWYVVDSGFPRTLRDSPYNARIEECEQAARFLLPAAEGPLLGDVSPEQFRRRRGEMPDLLRRRCEHFFSENQRVRRGLTLLSQGNVTGFGHLVTASGDSLVRDFDAGTPATTALLRLVRSVPGVLGASFAGGGFGGHLQVLGGEGLAPAIDGQIKAAYAREFPEFARSARTTAVSMGGGPRIVQGD